MRFPTVFVCLAAAASAQAPRIDVIDFFGLHKVSEAKIREVLGVKEGDPLPRSKGDVEEQLDQIPGVVESHLEAVYNAGKTILYVGIEERGAPHFDIREDPDGDATLPDVIVSQYRDFVAASADAARAHITAEDLTQGDARSADPATRKIQDRFPLLASQHLKELRDVLRNSSDEEQRAIAAYVIGYAPNKAEVMNDLQYALEDADPGVRANATHSLIAIAVLSKLDPKQELNVSPTWFIEMLNSISWSDRNRAVEALDVLMDKSNASAVERIGGQIRERSLTSLVEMARWKTLAHALPAYLLLAKIAGLPDDRVQAAWEKGDREWVIGQVVGKKKSK